MVEQNPNRTLKWRCRKTGDDYAGPPEWAVFNDQGRLVCWGYNRRDVVHLALRIACRAAPLGFGVSIVDDPTPWVK